MGRHRSLPARLHATLVRQRGAAPADHEQVAVLPLGRDRIEHAFRKRPREPLLGDEHDERAPRRLSRRIRRPVPEQRQKPRHGAADRLGIGVDGVELRMRLARMGGGDAAHGVDDGAELADAVDARRDVGQAFRHCGCALASAAAITVSASVFIAATTAFLPSSSSVPSLRIWSTAAPA